MEADKSSGITCAYPDLKMVRKCCVTGRKSNYLSEKEKVTSYRLPSDYEKRQKWIKVIPRDNILDSPNIVVCVKHFLSGFPENLDKDTCHQFLKTCQKA